MSLFICPVCGEPLTREEHRYCCPAGHCFDLAAAGYTHLLPANKMHSKIPGDDKEMSAARTRFLDGAYYAPLCEELKSIVLAGTGDRPAMLDSGCGEGYYTAAIASALREAGRMPLAAGIDISKFSVKKAAKRDPATEFAVASAYHLPAADRSIDLLLNCFSPLAESEFLRVLKPGGIFIYVVPAAEHLWELKQVLYDTPYKNEEKLTPYKGFRYLEVRRVRFTFPAGNAALQDLFRMTPYFWKTPKAGADRLRELDSLTIQAAFDIHVFRKEES